MPPKSTKINVIWKKIYCWYLEYNETTTTITKQQCAGKNSGIIRVTTPSTCEILTSSDNYGWRWVENIKLVGNILVWPASSSNKIVVVPITWTMKKILRFAWSITQPWKLFWIITEPGQPSYLMFWQDVKHRLFVFERSYCTYSAEWYR